MSGTELTLPLADRDARSWAMTVLRRAEEGIEFESISPCWGMACGAEPSPCSSVKGPWAFNTPAQGALALGAVAPAAISVAVEALPTRACLEFPRGSSGDSGTGSSLMFGSSGITAEPSGRPKAST
mmetsp:Transcript_67749/g.175483  ORF Transcript_67749/g.175483 Transcript_67749/m.175483 type:complete len:126 (+) Transcript_67749:1458-1835(+)